jgi:hypothetical protein
MKLNAGDDDDQTGTILFDFKLRDKNFNNKPV